MTENENGRPGGKPGAAVETNSAGGGAVEAIVPRRAGELPPELGRGDASVIPPSAGRTMTRAVTRCAECGAVTVHPFRDGDGDGVNGAIRRGACRHLYRLRVRRVLAQWARNAA